MNDVQERRARNAIEGQAELANLLEAPELDAQGQDNGRELHFALHRATEIIHDFLEDDQLWEALDQAASELSQERLDELNWLAAGCLEPLLIAYGYKCPPPPPVEELVSQTMRALAIAAGLQSTSFDPLDELRNARHYLRYSLRRIMLQVETTRSIRGYTSSTPLFQRPLAQRALNLLRDIVVPAVGLTAASATTAALLGDVDSSVAQGTVELLKGGYTLAAATFIGRQLSRRSRAAQDAMNASSHLIQRDSPLTRLTHLWIRINELDAMASSWDRARRQTYAFQYHLNDPEKQWRSSCMSIVYEANEAFNHYLDIALSESRENGKLEQRRRSFAAGTHLQLQSLDRQMHPIQFDDISVVADRIRREMRKMAQVEREAAGH